VIIDPSPLRPTGPDASPPGSGVRITILVDDHPGREGLLTEHGFSLWIESGGRRILFDTGQGKALEPNARALGIDLSETDAIVLSHGHDDHTGGLAAALARGRKAEVFSHPEISRDRFAARKDGPNPAMMPASAVAALKGVSGERWRRVLGPVFLADDIGVTGPIPRETAPEDAGGRYSLDPAGRSRDLFDDEIALWIRSAKGLIVFTGCAHAGLMNTLNRVRALTGGSRVRAVIGGFHLLRADADRLSRTAEALKPLDPDLLVPCHCTGEAAVGFFQDAFPGRVRPGAAGSVFRF